MPDEKPKNQEYTKLFSEVQQIRKRYLTTLASHKVFQKFSKLAAPNIVGKKRAEENVKTFGNYLYFFTTVKEAARCYFLIELAKFFDPPKKHNETRTIFWTLNYAQKNIHRLTKDDFLAFHEGREVIPEILATYKPFEKKDLLKFEKRLKRNADKISRLKTYRDQYLAHDDIKKIEVKITFGEMETLLRIVHDIIELFYNKLEFASNSYKNFEEEPVRDIERLVNDLAEHEKRRLEEIKKKYGV